MIHSKRIAQNNDNLVFGIEVHGTFLWEETFVGHFGGLTDKEVG